MKRFGIITYCLLSTVLLSAQTEKGRIMIGGGVDIASAFQGDVRTFNMSVTPTVGVFAVKNFVTAGRYSFTVSSNRSYNTKDERYITTTTYNTSVGLLLKYYFGKKQLKGLATAHGSYLVNTRMRKGEVTNRNGALTGASLGFAYFVNKNISVESAFSYNLTMFEKTLPVSRFGFSVGFSLFLNKKKAEDSEPTTAP